MFLPNKRPPHPMYCICYMLAICPNAKNKVGSDCSDWSDCPCMGQRHVNLYYICLKTDVLSFKISTETLLRSEYNQRYEFNTFKH